VYSRVRKSKVYGGKANPAAGAAVLLLSSFGLYKLRENAFSQELCNFIKEKSGLDFEYKLFKSQMPEMKSGNQNEAHVKQRDTLYRYYQHIFANLAVFPLWYRFFNSKSNFMARRYLKGGSLFFLTAMSALIMLR
jgi:hypothetical protein